MVADIVDASQVLLRDIERFGTGIEQMQMLNPRRDQQRPASRTTADVQSDTAAGRQQIPGKDAEIIVEDRPALLVRKMIRVLTEGRPFPAETARHLNAEVIVRADWNNHSYSVTPIGASICAAYQCLSRVFGGF